MSGKGRGVSSARVSRPTLAQVKAIVEFVEKHPDIAHRKLRFGVTHNDFKKLWIELSTIANSIDGAMKSTKGWIKFWSDKRRSIVLKQKQINNGKLTGSLTPLEQKILDLCENKTPIRKKRGVKQEPCNGDGDGDDNDSIDEMFGKEEDDEDFDNMLPNESVERQLHMMDKLVDVMGQQAEAMSQMAQASLNNSKAMERLAEASHIQALAVDSLATTFDTISSSVLDVRNALLGIAFTMKRCYPATATQIQNSNIFT